MPAEFKELFFSDPRVTVDPATGYIWKPVLRTGKWAAGPNGKPLEVIAGRSLDQKSAIGLQDIVDNFERVEHVTIPLSHQDRVDENTGFIRGVKIHNAENGVSYLMAAHDFTEPDVKGKVERGTIPNTSVGLQFDYIHKESGERLPVVLQHVAVTPRPWINGLTPFGIAASEASEYDVEGLEFSEPTDPSDVAHFDRDTWDYGTHRQALSDLLPGGYSLVTIARNSVLVEDESTKKKYVAGYSVEDGSVSLTDRSDWDEEIPVPSEDPNTGDSVTDPPSDNEPEVKEVSEKKTEETAPVVESKTITPEEHQQLLQRVEQAETLAASETAKREALESQVTKLSSKDRERTTEDFLTSMRDIGLSEDNGCTALLVFSRSIMLSDEGEPAALVNLSEDDNAAPVAVTASQILKGVIDRLPTDEKTGKLAIALSEQQIEALGGIKPPATDDDLDPAKREGTAEFDEAQEKLAAELAEFSV